MKPWSIQPRLHLDIGWTDLASVLRPDVDGPEIWQVRIAAMAPPGTVAVAGLSVRTLFDALLDEAGIGPGHTVVASPINIEGMAQLIQARGAALATVDLDAGTLASTPGGLAYPDAGMILYTHLYGPGPVLATRPERVPDDCLIVEDRAQAFDGHLMISPGADVALYSFGPIKMQTALGGAVALFRDARLAQAVAARLAAWPARSDVWLLRRVLKYAALKVASHPLLFGLIHRALRRSGRDVDTALGSMARGFAPDRPVQQAVRFRPPARLLRLLARRLQRAGEASNRPSRDVLDRVAALLPVPGLERETPPLWLLPVLPDQPEALIAALVEEGYDATRGATSMRVIGSGATPVAKSLMARVVYLPKPRTRREADRLITALRRATSATGRASLTETGDPT